MGGAVERWFFYENGMRKGPISRSSLLHVIRYGSLGKDTLVLRLGETEPVKLSETEFGALLDGASRFSPKRGRSQQGGLRAVLRNMAQLLRRPRQQLLHLLSQKSYRYQIEVWRKYYGDFDDTDCTAHNAAIQGSETGYLPGEFMVWLKDVTDASSSVLFAGDSRPSAAQMAKALGVGQPVTTGLLDVDHPWDFNDPIPENVPQVDAVVSLSMLEHILAPFHHVKDLVSRLKPGGHLMIFTCAPGFDYHRYPIDTVRFHIDWFEEVAAKLNLTVVRKRLVGYGVFVLFKR
jgi:hypothetical protein